MIARNLGRAGETVEILPLDRLAGSDCVDMLSIVLVGSSRTRLVPGEKPRVYTPRGYFDELGRLTVHFIGAGPGAPDLITVRGLRLIERCPVCLYAGSLVPRAVIDAAPAGARIVDTAPLTLDQIIDEIAAAHREGLDVARVHSGDPSLYGAIAEQMRRLDALGIPFDVTPGVPAFAAAAAALRRELTAAGGGANRDPDADRDPLLADAARRRLSTTFAASGATLAIHLSIANLARVVRSLLPHYGGDCPGGRRVSRRLARRKADPRHAWRHPRPDEGGRHHAHGADPGRPGAGRRRQRQPPIRRRPSSCFSSALIRPTCTRLWLFRSGAIRRDPLAPADPEQPRRGLGDARPDAIRIGMRLVRVLVAPAFGNLHRHMTVFVDQNSGQFDDLLLVHLTQVNPRRCG